MIETRDLNSNEPSSQINQVSSNNIYDDEISLKEVITILKEWTNYLVSKWLILSVVFAFGGLMVLESEGVREGKGGPLCVILGGRYIIKKRVNNRVIAQIIQGRNTC